MCYTKDAIVPSRKLYPSFSNFVPPSLYPPRGNQSQCQPCSVIMGPGQVYQLCTCISLINVLSGIPALYLYFSYQCAIQKMPLSLAGNFTKVYPILYPPVFTPQEETKPNANLVVRSWVHVRYTSSVAVFILLMCYTKDPCQVYQLCCCIYLTNVLYKR
jgi:hypothetical protein